MQISYINGDATRPNKTGNKIIVHICNDIGAWGKGFVVAISKRWKLPEIKYKDWHKSNEKFDLGQVQFVKVEEDIWVANLIGQHKIKNHKNGNPPIRYEAIAHGLEKVSHFAVANNSTIHMPRIGCGLAGGKWEIIEPLIQESLVSKGIDVTVYDL